MFVLPSLIIPKVKVSSLIHAEYKAFRDAPGAERQSIVFSSAHAPTNAFAIAILHCLNQERTSNHILCVYEHDDERRAWMAVVDKMSLAIHPQHLEHTQQEFAIDRDALNVAFIKRSTLYEFFPYKRELCDVVPFVSDEEEVLARFSELNISAPDGRGIASSAYPLEHRGGPIVRPPPRYNVYKICWHSLIYSSACLSDFVYDMNMLSVDRVRICLLTTGIDDTNEDDDGNDVTTKVITLAQYRQILSTFTCTIAEEDHRMMAEAQDDQLIEESELSASCTYYLLDEHPLVDDDTSVVLRKQAKRFKPAIDVSSLIEPPLVNHTSGLPQLREIIDFNSGMCYECETINSASKISMMLIYDAKMNKRLAEIPRIPSNASLYARTITDDRHVQMKCAIIEMYIMSQLNRQFYLLSPFVSFIHPLCNLPNVLNLHPTNMAPAHALPEDATLVVFDAIFINDPGLNFRKCRCNIIVAVYQHTREEEELHRYLLNVEQLAPSMRFLTCLPVLEYRDCIRDIESVFRLSIAHFYANGGELFANVYTLLTSLLDRVIARASKYLYHRDADYTKVRCFDLPDARREIYIQECLDSHVITPRDLFGAPRKEIVVNNHKRPDKPEKVNDSKYDRAERAIFYDLQDRDDLNNQRVISFLEGGRQYLSEEEWQEDATFFNMRCVYNGGAAAYKKSIRPPPEIEGDVPAASSSSSRALWCKDCGYAARHAPDYKRHMESRQHRETMDKLEREKPSAYHCPTCNLNFSSERRFFTHIDSKKHREHLKTRQLKTCGTCRKTMSLHNYAVHIASAHQTTNASFYAHAQTHCSYCDAHFEDRESMQEHNESTGHVLSVSTPDRPFETYELALNRYYLLFVAANGFVNATPIVDPCMYNVLLGSRNADFSTLCLIAACIRPTYRTLYRPMDSRCGFLTCSLASLFGIIGHFLVDDDADEQKLVDLFVEFFKEKEHTYIDYVPKTTVPYIEKALEIATEGQRKIVHTQSLFMDLMFPAARSYVSLVIMSSELIFDAHVEQALSGWL